MRPEEKEQGSLYQRRRGSSVGGARAQGGAIDIANNHVGGERQQKHV